MIRKSEDRPEHMEPHLRGQRCGTPLHLRIDQGIPDRFIDPGFLFLADPVEKEPIGVSAKHFLLRIFIFISWLLVTPLPTAAQGEHSGPHKQITPPVKAAIKARQTTQQAEVAWRLEKEKLVARLDQLQHEQARLEDSRIQLLAEIDAAQTRLVAKEQQLADMEQISSQIRPFIDAQVTALAADVTEGLPFLMAERQQRIAALTTLMANPAAAISEQYRKAMEVLLIETEYGFTTEVYRETITIDGQSLLADIFRLGRLGLFYQSLDRQQGGFFNIAANTWQPLPDRYNQSLSTAIEIAAKRRPVEILRLPLGRMAIQ